MLFSYKGKDYVGAQSGDTMTDPDHQKRGLFTRLAKKTYSFCEEEGINFVFGFPNENSLPGFQRKLNWEFFDTMYEFSLKGHYIPLAELAKTYPSIRGFYKRSLKNKLKPFILNHEDSVKAFSPKENEFYVKKDMAFFKYKEGPYKFLIQINGFQLFIKAKTHLYIGDVAYFDKSRLDEFINTLNKLARLVRSRKIVFYLSKNHWLYSVLSEKIEPIKSLPIGFLRFKDDLPFENISFTMADYDTF
jgi:hypothetical protein